MVSFYFKHKGVAGVKDKYDHDIQGNYLYGSSPYIPTNITGISSVVEHSQCEGKVVGSNPIMSDQFN